MKENKRITPAMVTELKEDEIFVFGSNLHGLHGGGAARYAFDHFGAEYGVGVGFTGQCYAIPTMQGGVETIKPYVDKLYEDAVANKDKKFLVTPLGCGIAGFEYSEIAPLFKECAELENVYLPAEFLPYV